MPDKYICRVVENEKLAENVYSVTVISGEIASEARAGQFLHIKCGEERLLRRPISICSVHGNAIEFVFEVRGAGTEWLSRILPGQYLDIIGPLGNGFSIPEGKIVTVGGGIGTPPMLFAAETARGEVSAVLGFQSKDRILLKEKFEAVCDKVYVTTDDGSFGICVTVTVPLQKMLKSGRYSAVLACGPKAMLSAVAELCKQYGTPCQVSMEERMGCGVGACLVCACETIDEGVKSMSRVCRDGPIFDAVGIFRIPAE